jgi:hypothetical protein
MSLEIISNEETGASDSVTQTRDEDFFSASLNTREVEGTFLPDRLFGGDKRDNQLPTSDKIVGHYKIIGSTLTACEANFWRVGIPWLPYTSQQIPSVRKPAGETIDSFIRLNLVGIPSDSLNCYLEDLESLPISNRSSATLAIRRPKLLERLPYFAISVLICLFIASILHLYVLSPIVQPIVLALFSGWLGLIFSLTTCSDPFRRFSFYRILSNEVARRSGSGNGSGKPKLKVCFSESA